MTGFGNTIDEETQMIIEASITEVPEDLTPGSAQSGSMPSTHNTFTESVAPQSKFDPKPYRKAQMLKVEESSGWVRKQQTVIPVRKPSKKQFVRAHHSPEYRAEAMPTITDEATGEVYLLSAELDLPADIENKVDILNLAAAMTADGSVFLWFYKNSTNSWSQSARIAISEASRRWVRVTPDMSSNGYLLEFPMVDPPDPTWPPMTFTQILETAFGSRFIDSVNHPQIKKLRGDFHV
jgi:hypothetical protein